MVYNSTAANGLEVEAHITFLTAKSTHHFVKIVNKNYVLIGTQKI